MLHTRPLKRRRSIDDGLWSMRQATCHSHRGTSLTHSIQQTIRSMSTDAVFPPCNTNYLSILYCQVLHALFMQATISETVNKKDGGVTLDGRELPGSESWSLMKLDCIRSKSKPEAQWWARICDSPSSKLGIWDVLFLWVSQVCARCQSTLFYGINFPEVQQWWVFISLLHAQLSCCEYLWQV